MADIVHDRLVSDIDWVPTSYQFVDRLDARCDSHAHSLSERPRVPGKNRAHRRQNRFKYRDILPYPQYA